FFFLFIFFFFSCFAYHRDLHSFPTRRSSDLTSSKCGRPAWRTSSSCSWSRASRRSGSSDWTGVPTELPVSPMYEPGSLPQASSRSEEHTSELQSLAYLVCRLLLEKKKKTKNN